MTLPRDTAHGGIITSADFGYSYLVKVEYNTDEWGIEVTGDAEHAYTLHGPFVDEDEAVTWMNAYPDSTDVYDMTVVTLNNVRP